MSTTADTSQSDQSGDQKAYLYSLALGLLARREHSRKELYQKLSRKVSLSEDHPDLIPALLDTLVEQGLLSDDRFTEAYVNMRARKGYGPVRITMELAEKGIDGDLAQHYLNARDDWQDLLLQTWRKKFRKAPSGFKEQARQMRFLQSRGYSVENIRVLFNCL